MFGGCGNCHIRRLPAVGCTPHDIPHGGASPGPRHENPPEPPHWAGHLPAGARAGRAFHIWAGIGAAELMSGRPVVRPHEHGGITSREADMRTQDGLHYDDDERREAVWARVLKARYGEVTREPMPDKFRELLDRLEHAEQRGR